MTSATMRAPVRHSSFFFLRSNGIRARSLPGYTLPSCNRFSRWVYTTDSPLAIGSHAGYTVSPPSIG
eukprot:6708677-Pyramimonas_sp.AAC.1